MPELTITVELLEPRLVKITNHSNATVWPVLGTFRCFLMTGESLVLMVPAEFLHQIQK